MNNEPPTVPQPPIAPTPQAPPPPAPDPVAAAALRPNPASIYPSAVSGGPLAEPGMTKSKMDEINENMAKGLNKSSLGLFGLISTGIAYLCTLGPVFIGKDDDEFFSALLGGGSSWGWTFAATFFAIAGFTLGMMALSKGSRLGIAAIAIAATIGVSSITSNIYYFKIKYETSKYTKQLKSRQSSY